MHGTKGTKNKFKKRKKKDYPKICMKSHKNLYSQNKPEGGKNNVRGITSIVIAGLKIYYKAKIIRTI